MILGIGWIVFTLWMLISGLWILATGKTMRKGYQLTGSKARIRGLILLAPLPIIIFMLVSAVSARIIQWALIGIVVACFVGQSLYSARAVSNIDLDLDSEH